MRIRHPGTLPIALNDTATDHAHVGHNVDETEVDPRTQPPVFQLVERWIYTSFAGGVRLGRVGELVLDSTIERILTAGMSLVNIARCAAIKSSEAVFNAVSDGSDICPRRGIVTITASLYLFQRSSSFSARAPRTIPTLDPQRSHQNHSVSNLQQNPSILGAEHGDVAPGSRIIHPQWRISGGQLTLAWSRRIATNFSSNSQGLNLIQRFKSRG